MSLATFMPRLSRYTATLLSSFTDTPTERPQVAPAPRRTEALRYQAVRSGGHCLCLAEFSDPATPPLPLSLRDDLLDDASIASDAERFAVTWLAHYFGDDERAREHSTHLADVIDHRLAAGGFMTLYTSELSHLISSEHAGHQPSWGAYRL
ncbi:hypothetical protein [Kushneria phosphatilytica]|uniref:Uncharacterized protein n=1 Tax=Kushneria phosphatilytica TaxID=657387 RepID=A0A1S1NMW6_9GAMM|nr:hypothetical protein [Kushneria phosphatilytica]OHV08657.1 hypothetical protein BH688_11495 [Kushneria phosphatilytica]QEL12371.1 hypothetical protein FY550_15320 [Kushneria phosphatilytica]